MDFKPFDSRNYATLPPAEGYDQWSRSYDGSVLDAMDMRLLERLETVDWANARRILDLACGTGRIGSWLRRRTDAPIDGVDVSEGMLAHARKRGVYAHLTLADIRQTSLPPTQYDLCVQSLADEHLPNLAPLYQEAARLITPTGLFVLVGYHPYCLLRGHVTHFHRGDGEPVAIESHIHLLSDHHAAAMAAGWALCELHEGLIDDELLASKPKWSDRRGWPFSFACVWHKRD